VLAVKEQTGKAMTLPIRQRKETTNALRINQPTHQLQPNAARVKWNSCYSPDKNCCSLEDLGYKRKEYVGLCNHGLYFRQPIVTQTELYVKGQATHFIFC
jgi:hypothetical protein